MKQRQVAARALGWAALVLVALCTVGHGVAHSQGGAPVIQVLESGQPLADGSWFNRAVTPVVQTTGGQSPVTVTALLDGAAFTSGTVVGAQGPHQLAVTAVDAAGTSAAPVTVGFTIKTTSPVFGALTPAAGTITSATQVTVTGTVDSAVAVTVAGLSATLVGGQSFSAGPIALTEGTNNLALSARDAAGNTGTATLTLVRDTVAPTVSISQPASGSVVGTTAVDVLGSASDLHLASVAVNGTVASVTGGVFRAAQVPLAEGSNTVTAVAVDQAGNQAQAAAVVVRDTTPPTLQITSPADGTVVPGATITVSGVASDAHLDRVLVGGAPATLQAASGGAAVTWSQSVPLQSGSNAIAVQAVDKVGNSSSASITVVRDSSAPSVHIDQPVDGARLNTATVNVSGTVQQKDGLVVTVNGVPAAIGANGTSFSLAGVALVEGQNRLVARATDPAGNQGVHSILVYRDTVAPQLAGADPASGAQGIPLSTAFRLTFSEAMATPASGSWSLQTAGGQAIAATATLSGSTLTVQPQAALPPAKGLLLVVGSGLTDLAGNAIANPQTLTYTTVDTSAPAAPVVGSVPAYVCASSVTLAGTAAAGSIIDVAGGAAAAETRADATTGQFTVAVLLTPGSLNRLVVTATSPATGAVSQPAAVQVVQDCQAPYVLSAQVSGGGVRVVFDKPVQAATVAGTVGAITVTAAAGVVAGTVTLSADGRTATFTPTPTGTPLPSGVLRLDVSTAVQDLAGNALAYPYTQLFGTGTAQGTSFLAGTVIDNAVGRPLAGAQVVVVLENGAAPPAPAPEQVTGGDGSFRVAVPGGTHQLRISRQGYTPVYRVVTVGNAQGASVFAPRPTPAAGAQSVGPAGGTVVGTAAGGAAAGGNGGGGSGSAWLTTPPSLVIPGGALAAATAVALTGLDEQGLPAPLPFGWSPRGAAWLDLGGAALSGTATLTLPVEAPAGAPLAVVRLDPATLQWRVVAAGVPVAGGAVTAALAGGGVDGGYAAVDPDTAAEAPAVPAAAVAGAVLPAAPAPAGTEVSAATLAFNPTTVLPAQTSLATALYTVAAGGVASGMPLTLSVAEQLTLLDGTTRKEPPYAADLVLYHAADGTARSRFRLAPSQQAQALPLSLGAEAVGLRLYAGGAAQGNVLGPAGGTYTSGDGDRVDVPPGALAQATPVGLSRVAAGDLPLPAPAGTVLAGALRLDLGGQPLLSPVALTLALPAAPAAGDEGLLLEATDFGDGPVLRPVAALQAAGAAWTTAPIVTSDLPWPGVSEGGVFLFVRLTGPTGYLHGTVTGPGAGSTPPQAVAGARVTAAGLGWTQATAGDGSYVLPVPAGTAAVVALDPATGNGAAASAAVPADGARVRLDLVLAAVPLAVTATVPADGATAVLPGIQPSVTFNRPVDPTSVIPAAGSAGGVQLLQGTQLVAADVTVQGATVQLVPRASLQPGTVYQLQVTTAVRDRYGNSLPAAVTASFTTQTVVLPSSFDMTRVFLVEPDPSGMAAVVGKPGALPAGALVFVENTTALVSTPSTTVGQDGSFSLSIQAVVTDRLLLHVLVTGQNEVQAQLGPFHSADLASALVDAGGAVFITGAGVTVSVPAGAFPSLTRVGVTPHAATDPPAAPLPQDFAAVYSFALAFTNYADGSAVDAAAAPLEITIPAPAGIAAAADGVYFLDRQVTPLGENDWMLVDLLTLDTAHNLLTTVGAAGPRRARASTRSAAPGAARDRNATRAPAPRANATTTAAPANATPSPATTEPGPLNSFSDRNAQLNVPGMVLTGQYQVQAPQIPLGWFNFPIAFDGNIAMWNLGMTGMATVVNASIERLVGYVPIPTRLHQPATIVVRNLDTGYVLFQHTFAPPADQTPVVVPPELLGDGKPPVPIGGARVRFFLIDPAKVSRVDLDTGISLQVDSNAHSMTLTGQAGAAQANVALRLLGLDDTVTAQVQANGDGSFTLSQGFTPTHRFVLAIGAIVAETEPLVVNFSKALDQAWTDLDVLDAESRSVTPQIDPLETRATVRISPLIGWAIGQTYTLHLGPKLNDGTGDAWGKTLDVPFQVEKDQVLNTFNLAAARDVARMGSMLFVAADRLGLVVLDASNPAQLTNIVPGATNANFAWNFPFNDPVRGVTVDPHGRVLVVGGGVGSYGQLKIFDPLKINAAGLAATPTDPTLKGAPLRGSTILSNNLGSGAQTQLPSGTPRRVASLTNDNEIDWFAGGTPPAGLTLTPDPPPSPLPASGEYTLTVAGGSVTKNRAVTLIDRTLGRFQRADAAADGTFSIQLSVRPGDQLALLENINSLAYVATLGVGVEVVAVDQTYNKPDDPTQPGVLSDVIGIYSGADDPKLLLCGAPVFDLSTALTDLGVLFDPKNPHPIVVAALVGNNGVVLLDSPQTTPGKLSFLTDICANFKGSNAVTGLAVVQGYAFDFNHDGRLTPDERRDYVVVTHRQGGVLIYDVTDRTKPTLVGQIPLPGEAAHVGVDPLHRLLYVAGYGGGLYVVDFNRPPSIGLLDTNNDGTDDRVLATIPLQGNTDAPVFVVPELGLAYAGGLARGVTSVAAGGPLVVALANNLQPGPGGQPAGGIRQVLHAAPFGVPTVVEGSNTKENRPGLIRIQANLPGSLGQQVMLDVVSLGSDGVPIPPVGDSTVITDLPRVSLDGPTNGVKFTRMADQPYQDGYDVYLSEPITLLADLKASHKYTRSQDENDTNKGACARCDLTVEKVPDKARELLSGDSIAVRFPQPLRAQLAKVYNSDQLGGSEFTIPSTRWERTPSPYREPIQGAMPQLGVMPHSGEMTSSAVDIRIPSRGMDFVFQRSYRGQEVGDGPFGPGWEHNFNQRLRELQTGDVQYFDGRGRRIPFQKCQATDSDCKSPAKSGAAGQYKSPPGVFSTLEKTSSGFLLLDPRHNLLRFDRGGRLLSIADAIKHDDATGNQITLNYLKGRLDSITDTVGRQISFTYDKNGHITKIEDFDGRDFTYAYDDARRLKSFSLPPALIALAAGPTLTTTSDPITTTYTYDDTTGDLATTLTARGRMTSVTDGKNQTWMQVSYADVHASGHKIDVASQTVGGGPVAFDYTFDQHTSSVTDPLGNAVQFTTNTNGQVTQIADPVGATSQYTYDEEGLVASKTDPLGRVTTYAYDSECTPPTMTQPQNVPIHDRRSRGDLTMVAVQVDGRGPNGSDGTLVTCTGYDAYTNQPIRVVDPRGVVTVIERDDAGLPVAVTRAAGTPQATLTQMGYNPYGQLAVEVNPNGHATAYQYSGLGYLQQKQVDATGLKLSTVYGTDDRGNVLTMIDPRGVTYSRAYNALDWVVASARAITGSVDGAPALGFMTNYLWDGNHNLVEEQLPFGDGSKFTRVRRVFGPLDELLIEAREVQPGDAFSAWAQTTYVYDQDLNLTQTIEPNQQQTVVTFDQRNLPVGRTRGAGTADAVHDAFAYDLEHHLTQYIDGRVNTWRTVYDGYGRVAATLDPLGNRSSTSYDNDGNPVLAQALQPAAADAPPGDVLLAQRSATYDLLGRRTSLTTKLFQLAGQPSNAHDLTTTLQYDPASNLVAVVDPLQRITRFVYDGAERKIATVDAAGNRFEHDLDANGNPVTTRSIEQFSGGVVAPGQGAVTVTTHATYDALNRLASSKDALGNARSFAYDARNNLTLSVDAEQNLTTQSWDGLDRLAERVRPEGIKIDYGYDLSSRLTSYTDALGNQTTYGYDALNRRVRATYPGSPSPTNETTAYDASGNPSSVTDANGTNVQQQFDAANRLISRRASGANTAGAQSESFTYDGLRRLTHGQSGNQATDLTFDSLSRRVREVVGGKTVTYTFDDAGNETAIGYPSGFVAVRTFDPLDRLQIINPANAPAGPLPLASFGYRGPDLLASQSFGNGLASARQFDAAKRLTDDWLQAPLQGGTQQTIFHESLAWTPRGLKSGLARADLAGRGLLFAYDKAERLAQAAKSPAPLTLAGPNTALKPTDLAGLPDAFAYTYDAAQNLLARTESADGVPATTNLPLDGSGRNRPGAANGVALQWDKNGNLIQKGNLGFHYDFRNRLVDVTDSTQANAVIAHYEYDLLNRRITKTAGATSRQTVWQGWRPIEDYDTSAATARLLARRTYGSGLDDIVYLESDLDGSGNVAAKSWPVYDSTGDLALLTNAAGKPLERYEYTPYGAQSIFAGTTPPAVQQVRIVNGAVWVELSEGALPGSLSMQPGSGSNVGGPTTTITLVDVTAQQSFNGLAVTQPVTTGDLALRRVVIAGAPPSKLHAGDQVTLTIPAAALVDTLLNQPAQDYALTFAWPAGDAVVADAAAPAVQRLTLRQGILEVELSSEPNLAAATAAIQIDGAALAWTLAADHYTLVSTTPVAAGAHTLTIATTLTDLGGKPLAAPFSQSFTAAAVDTQTLFQAPDPKQVSASTVGNAFGFQGLPKDPETGFVYFRNRYYDPDLGRFVTADPKGYVDGPSMYAFEMDDPANGSDPLGLAKPEDIEFPEGFVTRNGLAAAREADDPNNSLLVRAGFGTLATAAAPLSWFEQLGRGLLNTPSHFWKKSQEGGQHFANAAAARAGDDKAKEISRGVACVCDAFVTGASLAIPAAAVERSPVVNGLRRLGGVPPAAARSAGALVPPEVGIPLPENVWGRLPVNRGTAIEDYLAQTEYKDWYHVGAENHGKFPLVDFQKGNNLVSLKTVDTRGSTWLDRMQEHIDDLATRGAEVNGQPANMTLDLRVQPGGAASAQQLVKYGQQQGVNVVVTEFP